MKDEEKEKLNKHIKFLEKKTEEIIAERDKYKKAALALRHVVELCDPRPLLDVVDPIEPVVEIMCERFGYGAVMSAASRLWIRKCFSDGRAGEGMTVGPHFSTVIDALDETEVIK